MRWVVAYDVEADGVRRKLAAELESWGDRVQYSVFECDLGEKDVKRLLARLARILGQDDVGSIRAYRVCRDCMRASRVIGSAEPPDDEEYCWIVD